MSTPKIADKKPFEMELDEGKYWWCACGLSKRQPLCDSSHKNTGISPKQFSITEKKKVWLCMCKQTKNPPYCDGTHKGL